MIFYSHANKTYFHKKGFALSLVLKVRDFGTQKWPILTNLVPSPFSAPFHLRLRPDIFESAYFFFYTNCSSHHTKPVNLDSGLQGHLRPGPHDNQIKNTRFQKITGFVCTWPQGRRRSPEARLPFLVGRYCYLLDLTLTSMSTLFRGSS